jgi:hypothetical protein
MNVEPRGSTRIVLRDSLLPFPRFNDPHRENPSPLFMLLGWSSNSLFYPDDAVHVSSIKYIFCMVTFPFVTNITVKSLNDTAGHTKL